MQMRITQRFAPRNSLHAPQDATVEYVSNYYMKIWNDLPVEVSPRFCHIGKRHKR